MIGIVDDGIADLAATYRLQNRGHDVRILEAADSLGGPAAIYGTNSDSTEKFYHHPSKPEEAIIELAAKLGLEDDLEWRINKDVYHVDGVVHPLDTTRQIAACPHMSLYDKFRLSMLTPGVDVRGGIPDFDAYEELAEYEYTPIEGFVAEHTARGVYDNSVDPSLDGKFSERKRDVSASRFLGRMCFRGGHDLLYGEKPGYFDGGFIPFIGTLVEAIGREYIETDARVTELGTDGKAVSTLTVKTNDGTGTHEVESVVVATMSNVLEGLTSFPHNINPQGAVRGLVAMPELLMDTHWLNITRDAPFGSFIRHTNFVLKKHYGGDHLLHIANYVQGPREELWQTNGEEIKDTWLGEIEEMLPDFDRSAVEEFKIARNPRADPVYERGYLDLVVSYDPGDDVAEGVYYAGMASEVQYPERSLNGGIMAGYEVADRIDRS